MIWQPVPPRAAAAFLAYKNNIFVGIGGNLAGIDAIPAGQETMTVAVDGYDVGYLRRAGRSRCAERQKLTSSLQLTLPL